MIAGLTLSVMSPFMPTHPHQLLPVANVVRDSGRLTRLWQGQGYVVDPSAAYAYLAGCGCPVPAGLGVVTTPRRHPHDAALAAHTLATVTDAPAVYGVGPGSALVQEALTGDLIRRPARHVAAYLLTMKAALGRLHATDRTHPAFADVTPPSPTDPLHAAPRPPVELGIGVLRPAMARVAGAVADVAITWLTPPTYLREHLVPAIEDGARRAGRPRPRVVAMVPIARSGPRRDPATLAQASAAAHLALPHYAAMARAAGIPLDGDRATNHALIDTRAFLAGTAADIADGLRAYRDVGVDEVVLHLASVHTHHGHDAALGDLAQIAAAA